MFTQSPGVRARDPDPSSGQRGGPRGTTTRRKAKCGRTPLPSPSVLSVPSVVKIKREGGRIGGREAAGYYGVFRITTEGTGDTEGGRRARFRGCRAVSGSIERAGFTGWIPRRGSGGPERRGNATGENFLSPPLYALGALCGGHESRITTGGSGDIGGQERKMRFLVFRELWGSAALPGSMGWAPRGTLGEGNEEEGGLRTGSSPTPLCSLCPLW